ncbi:MAG: TusE/DsrC/DsvC family sulfur relay protein [Anaerolineaceae bacterium]
MSGILENIRFDSEGYMVDPNAWTKEIGEAIAARESIILTDRHWVVIDYARNEFRTKGESPSLRTITKNTDVTTKELFALFPGGPAKTASRVAGLGKPTGCV